jgi:ABC-type polysaccharide transport system, permease component
MSSLARRVRRDKYLYLMLLPLVLWYLVFKYGPMYGIVLSFQKFSFAKGIVGSPFVGLANFATLLADRHFLDAFRNTLIINSLRILVGFPIPILFALMLNEVTRLPYKRLVQTITYLPHFVSWVVFAGIVNNLLARDTGAVNLLVAALGGRQRNYLVDNLWFRWILVLSDVWKEMGWNAIIYLAAIAGINPEYYEAAYIDGANRAQAARYITLPAIGSVVAIMFIIMIGNVIQMGFDQVYNLYNPAVYETADILDTYIVRNLQQSPKFGVLAAADMMKAIVSLAFLLASNSLVKRFGQEGIY